MPEPVAWAGLGVATATCVFVGGAGCVAGFRLLDQFNAIQRIASCTATDFDYQLFERAVEDEPSFRELTRTVQRTYQRLAESCCGLPIAKRRAKRLRVALRRVLTDHIRLPPIGPPLLPEDPSPRKAHTPTTARAIEEQHALLEDPQFANSRIGRLLREEIRDEAETQEGRHAQIEGAQGAATASQPSTSSQPGIQRQPSAMVEAAARLAEAARATEEQQLARRQAQAQHDIDNRRAAILVDEGRRRAAGEAVGQSAVRPSQDLHREFQRLSRESLHMLINSSGSGSPLSLGHRTPGSSRAGPRQTSSSSRSPPSSPTTSYPAAGYPGTAFLTPANLGKLRTSSRAGRQHQDQGHIELQPLAQESGPSGSVSPFHVAQSAAAGSVLQAQPTPPNAGESGPQAHTAQASGHTSSPQAQPSRPRAGIGASQAQPAQQRAGGGTSQAQPAQPGAGRSPQTQPSMAGSISFDSLLLPRGSSPSSEASDVISKADQGIRRSQEQVARTEQTLSYRSASSASHVASQGSSGTASAGAAVQQPTPHAGATPRRAPAGSTASTASASSQYTPRLGSPMRIPRREAPPQASSSRAGHSSSRQQEATRTSVERRRAVLPSEPEPEDLVRRKMLEKAGTALLETRSSPSSSSSASSRDPGGLAPLASVLETRSSPSSSSSASSRDPGGLAPLASVLDADDNLLERWNYSDLMGTGQSSEGRAGSSRAPGSDSPRTRPARAGANSSPSGSDAGRDSPGQQRQRRKPGPGSDAGRDSPGRQRQPRHPLE